MPRALACFGVTLELALFLGPRTFVVHLHGSNPLSTVELNTIDACKMQFESGMKFNELHDMENLLQCNYNVKWNSLAKRYVSFSRAPGNACSRAPPHRRREGEHFARVANSAVFPRNWACFRPVPPDKISSCGLRFFALLFMHMPLFLG